MNIGLKKIIIGKLVGIGAGVIYVTPLMIKGASWDAMIAAVTLWMVAGIFTSTVDLKMNEILKGIFVSFLTILPISIIIFFRSPSEFLPLILSSLVLGALLGYFLGRFNKKQNQAIRSGRIYRQRRR